MEKKLDLNVIILDKLCYYIYANVMFAREIKIQKG